MSLLTLSVCNDNMPYPVLYVIFDVKFEGWTDPYSYSK